MDESTWGNPEVGDYVEFFFWHDSWARGGDWARGLVIEKDFESVQILSDDGKVRTCPLAYSDVGSVKIIHKWTKDGRSAAD